MPVIYGEDGECLKQILQVNPLHLKIYDHNFVAFIWLVYSWMVFIHSVVALYILNHLHLYSFTYTGVFHIFKEHTVGTSNIVHIICIFLV